MIRRGFDRKFFLRAIFSLVVAVAAGYFFHETRGYFPRIAILIGFSLGILTYMAIQTIERLWRLWRRPD